jgi:hypothetical protein
MKKLAVAATMVLSLGGVHAAFALSPLPTKALNFSSWMVRAYDQCSPSGLTVQGSNSTAACLAANGTTDDSTTTLGATMRFAKLTVRKFTLASEGRVRVTGRGFKSGQRIQVQLTLRVTQDNRTTKHPPLTGPNGDFR